MTTDWKVDRNAAWSQKMAGSQGRRCPLCKEKVALLIFWRV